MKSEPQGRKWPQGVRLEDFPVEAQKWAEQHANDPVQPERYDSDLPALRELARLTSWQQGLRDLWNLFRRRAW